MGVGVAEALGAGVGVAVRDGVGDTTRTGGVGNGEFDTNSGVALGVALGDGAADTGPCSSVSAPRADAAMRPSGVTDTSSSDAKTAPGTPLPTSDRSNSVLLARSIPVAVSVNAPPGSMAVIVVRYVPAAAFGTSTVSGSAPTSLVTHPGICRTILAPGIAMPHDRPNGSTTTMCAGECIPKRSVLAGAGLADGGVGRWFCCTVVDCPTVTSTV